MLSCGKAASDSPAVVATTEKRPSTLLDSNDHRQQGADAAMAVAQAGEAGSAMSPPVSPRANLDVKLLRAAGEEARRGPVPERAGVRGDVRGRCHRCGGGAGGRRGLLGTSAAGAAAQERGVSSATKTAAAWCLRLRWWRRTAWR